LNRGAGQQVVENRHGGGVVLVGTAADHGVLHAVFDHFVAETDGLAAGGAGRGGGDHAAGNAEHLGDVDRGGVHHGLEVVHGTDGSEPASGITEKGA
jgi:hypothetical protein